MKGRHERLDLQALCDGHTLQAYMVKPRYAFSKHIYDIYRPGMILCSKLCSTFVIKWIEHYVYLADKYLKSSRKLKVIDKAMLKV